ncbi:MAG TPA: XRE family transcriptional regulator [Acidimicrobiales bacterium]|nr:XRE family transcriptional regulator [Acidimicrobiales bacterium]
MRHAAGLTQTEVAERWGRHQSSVARIENTDLDTIAIGTLRAYLGALDATLHLDVTLGEARYRVDT